MISTSWNLRALILIGVILATVSSVSRADEPTGLDRLKRALQDPKGLGRVEAIKQLKITDAEAIPAAELLAPLLAEKNAAVQQAAASALEKLGPRAVPVLTEVLQSKPAARTMALAVLGKMGPAAKEALPAIVALSADKEVSTRRAAAAALEALGAAAEPALDRFLHLVDDPDSQVRAHAAAAVVAIGSKAEASLIDILKLPLNQKHWPTAAALLKRIETKARPLDPTVIPILIKHLGSDNLATQKAAAASLAVLGPEGAPALDALLQMIRDSKKAPPAEAAAALVAIGPKAAPGLFAFLKNTDDRSHWSMAVGILDKLDDKNGTFIAEAMKILIVHLERPDPQVRQSAAEVMQTYGPRAAAAAPALARLLGDADPKLRIVIGAALAEIGLDALPVLKQQLIEGNSEGRLAAANVLGKLAKHKKLALDSLLPLLADKDARIRLSAATSLGLLTEPAVVRPLARALADSHEEVRTIAAQSLQKLLKQTKSALSDQVEAAVLDEFAAVKDRDIRAGIATFAGGLTPISAKLRTTLIQWMEDPQPEVRSAAYTSLIRNIPAGPKNNEFRDPLVLGLHDKDPQIRRAVAMELAKHGKERLDVLVQVIENSSDSLACAEALHALAAFGPKLGSTKVLVAALRNPSILVRERALSTLEGLDPNFAFNSGLLDDPDAALRVMLLNRINADQLAKKKDTLVKLLRDENDEVRWAAARALSQMPFFIIEDVRPLLKDNDANVRRAAVQSLENHLELADLAQMMEDADGAVREAVSIALAKRGSKAFPTLVKGLRSENFRVQKAAARAIGVVTKAPDNLVRAPGKRPRRLFTKSVEPEPADELIPVLIEALLGKEPELEELAQAILRVNPVLGAHELASKSEVPALLALLKEPAAEVQTLVCLALAEKGSAATNAVPALTELLKDPKTDVDVLTAATRALNRIDSKESVSRLTPEFLNRVVEGTQKKSKFLREGIMSMQPANFQDDSLEQILAALYLGELTGFANDWIIQRCITDGSMGAESPNFIRVLGLFRAGNQRFPRRLNPMAEQALRDFCWRFINEPPGRRGVGIQPPQLQDTKVTLEQFAWSSSAYLVLDLLKDDPTYKDRKIQGRSLTELYQDWTRWWLEWTKQRPVLGVWSELSPPTDQFRVWACLLNMYDCASDPAVKQRCKMVLDLSLLEDEELSIGGNRANRRGSRSDANGLNQFKESNGLDQWKDLLCGEMPPRLGAECAGLKGAVWTTSYEAPTSVILLRKFRPISHYSVKNQQPGQGAITAYVTPHYILSSHVPSTHGDEFSGTWDRLVFDDLTGVFFTKSTGGTLRNVLHYQNLYVACLTNVQGGHSAIEYSSGLAAVERKGWLFLSNGRAYAAIRIVGGYEKTKSSGVVSLQPFRIGPMMILQAGDRQTFGSFEDFQGAILQAPLRVTDSSVHYKGPRLPPIDLSAPRINHVIEGEQRFLIDGQPFSYRNETMRLDSPYLWGKADAAQVNVRVGPCSAVYDFEKNSITPIDFAKVPPPSK